MDIRLDRVQLCKYNRCAAALMTVYANWTDWKLKSDPYKEPWVFISKRQLREDLMGVFGESSIERGIAVLESLDILRTKRPEKVCGAIWYLFDYKRANELLQQIPEERMDEPALCPNRRRGWEAAFGNNAEAEFPEDGAPLGNNAERRLGNNAEGASAILPTKREPLKETFTKGADAPEKSEPFSPPPAEENQNPLEGQTPDCPNLNTGPVDPQQAVREFGWAIRAVGGVKKLSPAESRRLTEEFMKSPPSRPDLDATLNEIRKSDTWHPYRQRASYFLKVYRSVSQDGYSRRPVARQRNVTAHPVHDSRKPKPEPSKGKNGILAFEELWAEFPRMGRTNRADALEEYKKQIHGSRAHRELMDSLREKWLPSAKWRDGYVASLSKWLRNRCWEEDPPSAERDEGTHYRTAAEVLGEN
jgi:hypothetical protein